MVRPCRNSLGGIVALELQFSAQGGLDVNSLSKQRLALAISAVIGSSAYAQNPDPTQDVSDEITVTSHQICAFGESKTT